jgi:hypothetical protein
MVENPAFANGFTSCQWADMADDWDAEGETNGQDRYLSGAYDVCCAQCEGAGKVRAPDFRAMPRNERRAFVSFLREQREAAEDFRTARMEYEAERRMGA